MASLGTGGCGYEHQLQSIRGGAAPTTAGQRPRTGASCATDAFLGIVILSDEDDCSGEPDADFFQDLVAGQAGSLRCALLGHVCNGMPVPAMLGFAAPLASCEPYVRQANETTSRLINVQEFVDYIKALKNGRVDKILVSSIIGWSDNPQTPYGIVRAAASAVGGIELDLAPACCEPATGNGRPGAPPAQFTQSFPNNTVARHLPGQPGGGDDADRQEAGRHPHQHLRHPAAGGHRPDARRASRRTARWSTGVPRDDSPTRLPETPPCPAVPARRDAPAGS